MSIGQAVCADNLILISFLNRDGFFDCEAYPCEEYFKLDSTRKKHFQIELFIVCL